MIASVAFRNFKALRNASVQLGPFNLVVGPNGSGKTSLIESLLHLRTLSKLAPIEAASFAQSADQPEITFRFSSSHDALEVKLGCVDDLACDALQVSPVNSTAWPELRAAIGLIRSYVFDHKAMAGPASRQPSRELSADGGNLASVLLTLQEQSPEAFTAVSHDLLRLFPEFAGLELQLRAGDTVAVVCPLQGGVGRVDGSDMSQGLLYTLAILTLSHLPWLPTVLCIEEVDRGIHPRMLREIRDAFYRLSYPSDFALTRPPVQVIATAHSPYLLDLFREHPEEVIVTQKQGTAATFQKLSDRPDLPELLREGSLGDLWFSGVLGGVPEV